MVDIAFSVINWLKDMDFNYYQQATTKSALPKAIFRLGANHCGRGLNFTHVFDIGNFVSELASQMGTQSFHVYVIGKKGTQNAYNPFSKTGFKCSSGKDLTAYNGFNGSDLKTSILVSSMSSRPEQRAALFNRDISAFVSAVKYQTYKINRACKFELYM